MCSEKRPEWKFHHRQVAAAAPPQPLPLAWPRARARVCRVLRECACKLRPERARTQTRLSSHWHRPGGRLAAQEAPGRGGDHPRRVCARARACSARRAQRKREHKKKRRQTAQALQCCHAPPRGLQQRCRKHRGERVSSRPAAAAARCRRRRRPRRGKERLSAHEDRAKESAKQVQETPSAWAGAVIARERARAVARCVRGCVCVRGLFGRRRRWRRVWGVLSGRRSRFGVSF